MFRHLSDTTKALVFYAIAFGLAVLVTLLSPLIGDIAGFVTMFPCTVSRFILTSSGPGWPFGDTRVSARDRLVQLQRCCVREDTHYLASELGHESYEV